MRVFVAGATGAFGRAFVPRLVDHGHHVVASTRTAKKARALEAVGAEGVVLDLLVVAMTILALVLDVLLSLFCSDTDQLRAAAETCSTTYKMGFGAIVGLIGGKAT